jgi:AmmeMemoRadiSam system protein B/AmmeMemoRadiSam system protein A
MSTVSPRHPRRLELTAALAVVFLVCGCSGGQARTADEELRPASQAGRFYPASAVKLRAALDGFLKDAAPARTVHPLGLVLPHAGYIFSGQIAADGFRQAAGETIDTVVLLGTNHTTPGFDRIGLSPARGFETPLGVAAVDVELRSALLAECGDCLLDARVHADEHSIEVQVPFVQTVLPGAKILPIIVGSEELGLCQRFGALLGRLLAGRRVLVVASSDLAHYPTADDAERIDRESLDAIASLDTARAAGTLAALRSIPNLSTRACGAAPVLVAMTAVRALGAQHGVVISYANSGRTPLGVKNADGEQRAVGYGAVAFTAEDATPGEHLLLGSPADANGSPLTTPERHQLLAYARESLRRLLTSDTLPLPRGLGPRLWQRQGAFVTLKKHGALRGCIGRIPPQAPLGPLVGGLAFSAALEDPRFSPVTGSELESLSIEISVLTPPKRIARAAAIVVGRDGVVLRKGVQAAVYLPQVATEQGWGRDQMLDSLCEKAGLVAGCWRADAELSVFEAEVFHEGE